MNLAHSLQSEKKSLEAITVYEQALKQHPHHRAAPEAYLSMAQLYYVALQQPDQALAVYQKMIQRYPDDKRTVKAFQQRVHIVEEQENWTTAIEAYADLLERFPQLPEAAAYQFKIGQLHYKQGDLRQGQLELEKFLEKHPKGPWSDQALFQLGDIAFQQRNFKKAIDYYQKLAEAFPDSSLLNDSEYNRGLCLEHVGEWDEALKIYHRILTDYHNPETLKEHIRKLEQRRQVTGRG